MEKQIPIFDCILDKEGLLGPSAISLVNDPAMESRFVTLSKAKELGVMEVHLKAGPVEKRMIYGAVLIPDKLIYRVDKDRGEYYIRMSAEVIEEWRERYMKRHLQQAATLEHTFPVEGLTTVELWTKISDQDKSVALGFNEPDGTLFAGMKCDDDKILEDAKAGIFTGFSVESWFNHVQSDETILETVMAELAAILRGE